MGTATRDRVRAHRARQREQGKIRLSVTLDAAAFAALGTLRARHPDLSLDTLFCGLLTAKIPLPGNEPPPQKPLPGNKSPRPKPLPGNKRVRSKPLPGDRSDLPRPLPGNTTPLPGNAPQDRAALAVIGHQYRSDGLTLEAIAERFNQSLWTPDLIPKQQGQPARADSPTRWTAKAVSQLLNRDYPRRD